MKKRTFGIQASWDDIFRGLGLESDPTAVRRASGIADSINQQIEEHLNRYTVTGVNSHGNLSFDAATRYEFTGRVAVVGSILTDGVVHSGSATTISEGGYMQYQDDGGAGIDGPGLRFVINGVAAAKIGFKDDDDTLPMLRWAETNDGISYDNDAEQFDVWIGSASELQLTDTAFIVPNVYNNTVSGSPAANVNVHTNGSLRRPVAGPVSLKRNIRSIQVGQAKQALRADAVFFDADEYGPIFKGRNEEGHPIWANEPYTSADGIGFISEQVDRMVNLPVVHRDEPSQPGEINYQSFTVMHNVLIDDHEQRIESLESRLEAAETAIMAL